MKTPSLTPEPWKQSWRATPIQLVAAGMLFALSPLTGQVLPELLKDIDQTTAQSSPSWPFTEVNGDYFFGATDWEHGSELWRTDGTEAGTALVKDAVPGPLGWSFGPSIEMNGALYTTFSDRVNGNELWRSDGTAAGTYMLKDINPGAGNSSPGQFTYYGGYVYFSADDGVNGRELWRTDGTPEGTELFLDLLPGAASSNPNWLTVVEGNLLFNATDGLEWSLWTTDGTVPGTSLLKAGVRGSQFTEFAGLYYFSGETPENGRELWVTDGTPEGTELFFEYKSGFYPSNPGWLTVYHDYLYFTINGFGADFLYRTDGANTERVYLFHDWHGPGNLTIFNDAIYFLAGTSDATGRELWRLTATPGTSSFSVQLFKELAPGPESTKIMKYVVAGNQLFFTADDSTHGTELWVSDGTPAGTHLVADLMPGEDDGVVGAYLFALGDDVIFAGDDGIKGEELWRSDGTEAGTYLIKDINSHPVGSSSASGFTEANGRVYFQANDAQWGDQSLWVTDRTEAGTVPIASFDQGIQAAGGPGRFVKYGGKIFFSAGTEGTGRELYVSDGSYAGTGLLKDINPGPFSSSPSWLTLFEGYLYFASDDGASGGRLWVSDGTATGTRMLVESPGPDTPVNPRWLTHHNGTLFFVAYDPTHGHELWRSNGTEAGTVLVLDINPGPTHSIYVQGLVPLADQLMFVADDGATGFELWRTDGTYTGTVQVKNIAPDDLVSNRPEYEGPVDLVEAGGVLYFTADDGVNGRELWRSDGTKNGTRMVTDLVPGPVGAFDSDDPEGNEPGMLELTAAGGHTFFSANDTVSGFELWKTDGTASGTTLVKDIAPGAQNSWPRYLVPVNGKLFFSAKDPINGFRLWESDGTAIGTRVIPDAYPSDEGIGPAFLVNVRGTLFFRASDGQEALSEPWIYMVDGAETPVGANVPVSPVDTTTGQTVTDLSFTSVTEDGATTVSSKELAGGEEPPAGFKLGDPPVVFDINTSASFDGPVQVCIDYSSFNIADEASLRLYHSEDGVNWNDITTSLDTVNDVLCGEAASFSLFGAFETDPDSDGDGLGDARESRLGTHPSLPDTDGDGLLDGTEVEMANHQGCPHPLIADSDSDGLLDGYEVSLGTNPCSQDSDGDGILDTIDSAPLDPDDGGTVSNLEQSTRNVANWIAALAVDVFNGPNDNANAGRRNSLSSRVRTAANAVAEMDYASAYTLLNKVLDRADGDPKPEDWLEASPDQGLLTDYLNALIEGVSP